MMKTVPLLWLFLIAQISINLLLSSCGFIQENPNYRSNKRKLIKDKKPLVEIKDELMKPVPSGEALNSLMGIYHINPEEIDEIWQIYESTQDYDLRQIILQLLNENTKYMLDNKRVQRFYKNLVHSKDKLLAAIAFRGLISAELTRDENNKDQ